MMSALFFEPIPFVTVWGGESIKRYFGYDWMPDRTGQAWAFSAQDKNSNVCMNGSYAGMTLRELWEKDPQLFGDTDRDFPPIVSLLCPCDRLSIQLHPDAERAKAAGYSFGKNEAWYFLETAKGADIVFGHNAVDENDLRSYVSQGRWDDLVRHLKVHDDDFVYIPAGTLHACGANVIVYEVQQSTDVTYRFYDYDRVGADGAKRQLHLEQAIDCLKYGSDLNRVRYDARVEACGGCIRTTYTDSPSFTIEKLVVDDDAYVLEGDRYELVSVVRGTGTVDGEKVAVGSHFLAPLGEKVEIAGNLTCMMTTA